MENEIPQAPTGERLNPSRLWDSIIITDFVLVGAIIILGVLAYIRGLEMGEITTEGLLQNLSVNMILFAALPLLWVWKTRVNWPNIKAYFHVGNFEGVIWGVGLGLVSLMGMGLLLMFLSLLGVVPDAPGNDALVAAVDWKLALLVAAVAAFSEEILFRGVLQNLIGPIPQAIIFGLAHAGAGSWVAMLATALLGLTFGLLRPRIGLYGLMAAHFTYNLTIFAIGLLA